MSGTKTTTLDTVLVKAPHRREMYTDQQLTEFAACADPVTGPMYFLDNHFFIQHPTRGKMRYHPFDYQKRLINTYHDYRYSISMMPRQTGKSTSAAGYLLWMAMFVSDSTILIAAHKYTGSQEIMQRIRYAYELCPNHIRAGATSYNKGSIDFENGSRIISATTTETTGRGMSISLLYCLDGDTTVRVRNKKTLVEEDITLRDLYIQMHNSTVVKDYVQQLYLENAKYEILTPTGWQDFKGVTETHNKETFKITLASNETISATAAHNFFVNGGKVQLRDLRPNMLIDTVHGPTAIDSINLNGNSKVYDIIECADINHQFIANATFLTKNCDEFAFVRPTIAKEFWTSIAPTLATGGKAIITSTPNSDEDQFALLWKGANKTQDDYGNPTDLGINGFKGFRSYWNEHPDRDAAWAAEQQAQLGIDRFRREHGCEFVINDETLIAPAKLIDLEGIEPIHKTGQVRWYQQPKPGEIYVVALDPSLGTGGDPAAIEVFEAGTTTQIAEWRHNKTTIPEQIRIMADIITQLNAVVKDDKRIYYSVENNSIGEAALISIAEYGEENIPGYFLSDSSTVKSTGRRFRKGFTTTRSSKITACNKFKILIETNRMKIHSRMLVSELKTFVAYETSYAAKPGETDDLVMGTLLVVRMLQLLQNYHTELDSHMKDHGDNIIEPLPFISFSR